MSHTRLFPFLLVGLILASVTAAWGAGVGVTPVRIHLSATQRSEMVQLTNTSSEAISYQIVARQWRETADGQMKLRPTRDLLFFPSLLEIKPGETRSLRVASNLPPGSVEKSYRLVAEELPGTKKPGEVQVLTNLSIPVFVRPAAPKPAPKLTATVRGGLILVSVENMGNAYFKTQSVRVVARSSTGASVFDQTINGWYVLAGARRLYKLNLPAGVCEKVATINAVARTEQVKTNAETTIQPGTACQG